jgi:hypothetical protein
MLRDARSVANAVLLPFRISWWVLGTAWLGTRFVLRSVRIAGRIPVLLSQVTTCPRGHEVPLYGVFECACRAIHEGHVFGRCGVCGETPGFTVCPTCQLPILNPLL